MLAEQAYLSLIRSSSLSAMQLYHFRSGQKERGPYSLDQLVSMWKRGLLHPVDEIRTDGEQDWQRADQWMKSVDSRKNPPYQLMIDEQAPVDLVRKTRRYPNRGLAIVTMITALGLLTVHWAWSICALLLSFFLWKPAWHCGTCHKPVTSKDDWCSQCGSHLQN